MTTDDFLQNFKTLVGASYPAHAVGYVYAGRTHPETSIRMQSLLWEFRLICRRLLGSAQHVKLSGMRLIMLVELEKIKSMCNPNEWGDCQKEVYHVLERACRGLCDTRPSNLKQGDTDPSYRPPTLAESLRDGFKMLEGESL